MELVVVFAECAHGGCVEAVAVQQAHGEWSVVTRYACAEGCSDRETLDSMPANVVDTEGAVRWSAP